MPTIADKLALEQTKQPTRRLPIITLFTANIISFVGDYLRLLSIPWFVLTTTGSVTQTGITAFCEGVSLVLSSFLGGAIVDRLGYKRASILSDLGSGITVMLIPLLHSTMGLQFWQLLISGILSAPGYTARSSILPELAGMANMPLERANSFFDGIRRVSGFLGAPLAGLLIALIGASNLLWLDALSFIISALLVSLFVPTLLLSHKASEQQESGNYLANLRDGLRYLRNDSLMLSIIAVVVITNLLDAAFFSVMAPVYVKEHFDSPIPLGILAGTLGGAAFVGTLIFAAIGHRLPKWQTFSISFVVGGSLRFFAYALLPVLPFLIGVHIVAGLLIGCLNPLIMTFAQQRIPPHMRARVFGITSAGAMAGVPLGTLLAGYLVEGIGMTTSLLAIGIIYLLATASLLVNQAIRQMQAEGNK